jgi:hypothetical protein
MEFVHPSVQQGQCLSPLARFPKVYDFGPGFKISRLSPIEDPLIVRYWISIWDTIHLRTFIDIADELRRLDKEGLKVEGIGPHETRAAMQISSYLRNLS